MKVVRVIFIALCSVAILLPSVGMFWAPTNETTENRELAAFPHMKVDGEPNINYLSELGTYFEDHFAYKNELVTANAKLRSSLGVSSAATVIVGKNGWLYYSGTLNDYLGKNLLTQKEIDNIAFNVSLMQAYCEANGATFAITVPPNKNTIYPENMPYYYAPQAENETSTLLSDAFARYGVHYANAFDAIPRGEEGFYYTYDSHWTEDAARLAVNELLQLTGKNRALEKLRSVEAAGIGSNVGDLSKMLYPSAPESDPEKVYDGDLSWKLLEGENTTDIKHSAWLEAEGAGDGTLFMYRDSFAKNMLPFLSSAFSDSYYDWHAHWDLRKVVEYKPTVVICEKVERNVRELIATPIIMPAPTAEVDAHTMAAISSCASAQGAGADQLVYTNQNSTTQNRDISIGEEGNLAVIEGCIPAAYANEDLGDLYITIEKDNQITCYVPFRVTIDGNRYGYRAYVHNSKLEDASSVSVVCNYQGEFVCVQRKQLS